MTDADEWKFFKAANNLKTPLERDLFHSENNGEFSIFLSAMETIYIPFKYDSVDFGSSTQESTEIKTIFKTADSGEPFSILELAVQQRRYALGQSVRWFHEETSKISKLLRVQGIPGKIDIR